MEKDSFEGILVNPRLQSNPLLAHLRTFAVSLREDGYADATMGPKISLLARLGEWLQRSQLTVEGLDEQHVETYVKHEPRIRRGDLTTFSQFLAHLRNRHLIPDRACVNDNSPAANILNTYEEYLRSERGLVGSTILNYKDFVRKFLVERFRARPVHVRELTSSDISAFVLQHAPAMSPRRAQFMTSAFRSFFRFLFRCGELETDLAVCVPTVAGWRLATAPKYLTPEEVARCVSSKLCKPANTRI